MVQTSKPVNNEQIIGQTLTQLYSVIVSGLMASLTVIFWAGSKDLRAPGPVAYHLARRPVGLELRLYSRHPPTPLHALVRSLQCNHPSLLRRPLYAPLCSLQCRLSCHHPSCHHLVPVRRTSLLLLLLQALRRLLLLFLIPPQPERLCKPFQSHQRHLLPTRSAGVQIVSIA